MQIKKIINMFRYHLKKEIPLEFLIVKMANGIDKNTKNKFNSIL